MGVLFSVRRAAKYLTNSPSVISSSAMCRPLPETVRFYQTVSALYALCEYSHNPDPKLLDLLQKFNKNVCLLCEYSHMTAAEQLGSQIRTARGQLSLRALSEQVEISASTLSEYERGVKVPEADKLARIADALNHFTFRKDDFTFTVTRTDVGAEQRAA